MSHTKESIMDQAQVFASGWSLVGGVFDQGYALEDAKQAKEELAKMVGEVIEQRDRLSDLCDTWNSECDDYRAENRDPANQLAEALKQRDELLSALEFAKKKIAELHIEAGDGECHYPMIDDAIDSVKGSEA